MASNQFNKVFKIAGAITSAAVLTAQPGSQLQNEQGSQVLVDVQPASEQMVQAAAPKCNVSSRMPRAFSKVQPLVVPEADVAPTSKNVMSKRNPSVRVCRNGHECCADQTNAVVRSAPKEVILSSSKQPTSGNAKVTPSVPIVDANSEASPVQSPTDVSPAVLVEAENQIVPPTSETKAQQVKSQRAAAEVPVDAVVVSAKPAIQSRQSRVAEVPVDAVLASAKPAIQSRQSRVAEVPVDTVVLSAKPAPQPPQSRVVPVDAAAVLVEAENQTAPPTSETKAQQVKSQRTSRVAEIPVDTVVVSTKPAIQSRQSRVVAADAAVVSVTPAIRSRQSRTSVASRHSRHLVSAETATPSTSSRPETATIVVENKNPSKVRANISKSATNVQINTTPSSLECILNNKPSQKKATTIRITDKSVGHPNRQRLIVNLGGNRSNNHLNVNSAFGNASSSSPVSMMGSQQPRNTIVMAHPNTNVSVCIN